MTFAATVQADRLQAALAPVSTLVDECKLRTTADGLSITAVDPANVAMVSMSIDASAFASYQADGGVLGLALERFESVLGMADGDEMVSLDLDEETRKLHIDIGGLSYTQALIDPESVRQEPDIPDLDLPATFVVEGREIARAVSAAELVSDHIEIGAVQGVGLQFSAEGDTDDVRVTVDDEDLLSRRHDAEESVASLFSLDYLSDMKGPIGSETEVSLLVGQEMPIKLRYSLADGDVSVTNLVAPRIKSD